jgi:hypothetical protein
MTDLQQTIHDLPLAGLVPVLLLVVTGMLLWVAGRKLLRAGFAAVGFIVGGALGWFGGESLRLSVSPWILALVGAVVLSVLSAVAFKLAVMWTLAIVLGILAPLGVIVVHEQQAKHGNASLENAGEKAAEWFDKQVDGPSREKAGEIAAAASAQAKEKVDEFVEKIGEQSSGGAAKKGIEQIEHFGSRFADAIKQRWNAAPESLRPMLVISSIVGIVLGLILGFAAPNFSAAAVTSLGGSLLWLTGLRVLLTRIGVPEGPWLPASGGSWMAVWLITAFVGMGIQWTAKRRKADKKSD